MHGEPLSAHVAVRAGREMGTAPGNHAMARHVLTADGSDGDGDMAVEASAMSWNHYTRLPHLLKALWP